MKKCTALVVVLLIAASAVNGLSAVDMGSGKLGSSSVFNGAITYKINKEAQSVDVYENNDLRGSIDLSPNSPVALAITPDGRKLYVACRENIIRIIDAITHTSMGVVIDPRMRIRNPVNLLMKDNGVRLWVVNEDGSMVIVDTAADVVIR